jgi:hypothetical protein
MFLRKLQIKNKEGVIREIFFRKGVNLIVDETPESQQLQTTGNNVGKTTLLRLIDYCLGAKGDDIYKDHEFLAHPNTEIEDFLIKTEVLLTLEMIPSWDIQETNGILIKRNFLKRKQKIQSINGITYSDDEQFREVLKLLIFHTEDPKPSFRQIIAKNIRITPERMSNIVKVLGNFAKKEEYEALFLFWLGIGTTSSAEKSELLDKKREENRFQKRLIREGGDLTFIEQQLVFHVDKIEQLEKQKADFSLNKEYNEDINALNHIKLSLNTIASKISVLEERKALILESKADLEVEQIHIDTQQIALLYQKAKALIPNIQVSFEQTVRFHNDLITQKLAYITHELPEIEQELNQQRERLVSYRKGEISLTEKVKKIALWESLEKIISELNKHYERKGSLEKQKEYWLKSIERLGFIEKKLKEIDHTIEQNDAFIRERITLFNKYFSQMSNLLYGEHYLLFQQKRQGTYDLVVQNVEGNPSTGKKKGQIAAFDFAYIQFADELLLPSLHFILHDQLENIHDNQLNTLFEVANGLNGQYIVPILRDKIPQEIDINPYTILTLSQEDKLFRQ